MKNVKSVTAAQRVKKAMRDLIRLTDLQASDIYEIFHIADEISEGKYDGFLRGKSVVLFFTAARYADVPVINAMTDKNHPCEILTDLYSLSKIRDDFIHDKYLFCGKNGNIGLAWKEASEVLGFELSQCCSAGYEMDGVNVYHQIETAVRGKEIICTDSLSAEDLDDFKDCQVTRKVMSLANENAVLNPCPPFYRGEEVSADAIESDYFVGYAFKKNLLVVQQAVMVWCMNNR